MAQPVAGASTSASLLVRLQRPDDAEAWQRFTALYTPLLFFWARKAGLQEADAADLVQEVFAVLLRTLSTFEYQRDRTFRGWLRVVLLNKHRELRRRKAVPIEGEAHLDELPDSAFDSACDEASFRGELLRQALELLRPEVPPLQWEAFHRTALLGQSGHEVARDLGVTPNAIYIARSRVLQQLRDELAGMIEDLE